MEETKKYLDLEGLEYYTEKILNRLKAQEDACKNGLELGKLGAAEEESK